MRLLQARAVAAVFLAGPIACASTSSVEVEMSRMRREMAVVKKDLAESQLAVQRLEGQLTLLSVGRDVVARSPETAVAGDPSRDKSKKAVRDSRNDQNNRVLPVVRLGSKAEVTESHDTGFDAGAGDDGSPPLMIRMGPGDGDDGDRLPVDRVVLERPNPVANKRRAPEAKEVVANEATSAAIEAEYQAALEKLRAEGKPAEALSLFNRFRDQHPKSNLADNAAFWSGECHVALRSHKNAITEFERVVNDYPRSSKRGDAMVRIGESWLALSENDKAKAVFQRAIDSYPKTEAAGRARAKLAELGRGGS